MHVVWISLSMKVSCLPNPIGWQLFHCSWMGVLNRAMIQTFPLVATLPLTVNKDGRRTLKWHLSVLHEHVPPGTKINIFLRFCLWVEAREEKPLLRWGGYLPLTKYSEHPFWLVVRTLERKDSWRLDTPKHNLQAIAQHQIKVISAVKPIWVDTMSNMLENTHPDLANKNT